MNFWQQFILSKLANSKIEKEYFFFVFLLNLWKIENPINFNFLLKHLFL